MTDLVEHTVSLFCLSQLRGAVAHVFLLTSEADGRYGRVYLTASSTSYYPRIPS